MSNLASTARLHEWGRPAPIGQHENLFIYLFTYFSSWVQGLLVLGSFPAPCVTFWVLHVAPAIQELTKHTKISFVGCTQGIRLKDPFRNDLPPFH